MTDNLYNRTDSAFCETDMEHTSIVKRDYRILRRCIFAAGIVFLVCFVLYNIFVSPDAKYRSALSLAENGNGCAAVAMLDSISDSPQAKQYADELRKCLAPGKTFAAGRNNVGQCDVSAWRESTALAARMYHSVGLKSDGTVVATGENLYGQ